MGQSVKLEEPIINLSPVTSQTVQYYIHKISNTGMVRVLTKQIVDRYSTLTKYNAHRALKNALNQ